MVAAPIESPNARMASRRDQYFCIDSILSLKDMTKLQMFLWQLKKDYFGKQY
jgi:hypothetical protein